MLKRTFNSLLLPFALRFTSSDFVRRGRMIARRQHWSNDQMAQLQRDKLQQILRHAAQVPFYRERFEEHGVAPEDIRCVEDLARLPILTKADLQANFPDRMSAENRCRDDWQYRGTRGTTNRVIVVHDFQRRDTGLSLDMVALTEDSPHAMGRRMVQIPPDDCSIHCGIETRQPRSVAGELYSILRDRQWKDRAAVSELRGRVMEQWIQASTVVPPLYREDVEEYRQSLRDCLDVLGKRPPSMLWALPEYLRDLAQVAWEDGRRIRIPVVRPFGSNLSQAWKPEIAAGLGGQVREHYGASETGPMAFDCRHGNGLHVISDQFVIEIVRDGQPVDEGEVGTLLVTDLSNMATPLIRYQIEDLARISYEPCACGRTTPRLFMEGRTQDAFPLEDGSLLTSETVCNRLWDSHRIGRFQITEKSNGIKTCRVVPPSGGCRLMDVASTLHELFGSSEGIRLREVPNILPESSGKFRYMKPYQALATEVVRDSWVLAEQKAGVGR